MRWAFAQDWDEKISSEACRENAKRFSVKHMIDRYEALCIEAIEGGEW